MGNYTLDPEFWDSAWDDLPEPQDSGKLDFSQVQAREEWIVKLRFQRGGSTYYGTGFYINIPDADKYVILTAAHNLVDEKGIKSKNLSIQQLDGSFIEQDLDIRICEQYLQNPGPRSAINDYGAILSVRDSSSPPRGFGFSLKLGLEDLDDKNVEISGYRIDSATGGPKTSSGRCVDCTANRMEYDVTTEPGLSGSPVLMPYNGHETVVGIHTHGGDPGAGTESKGVRLNEVVLCNIFHWVGTGYYNKTLKVFDKSAHSMGLYLRFSENKEFGRVRLGSEGLETAFDIIPAYAPTSTLKNSPLYVFRFKSPAGWVARKNEKWVLWMGGKQRVGLTKDLHDFCFVRVIKNKKKPTMIKIVIPQKETLVELRMQAKRLRPGDIALGVRETPEISFGKYLKGQKVEFNNFSFEEAE